MRVKRGGLSARFFTSWKEGCILCPTTEGAEGYTARSRQAISG
jgi:hypothetical protein